MSDGVSELPLTQTDRLSEGHWLVHEIAMAMGFVQGDRRDAPQVYKAVKICYKIPGWHAHPTKPPDTFRIVLIRGLRGEFP